MAKIKVAIDCGHGENTAGKRTPGVSHDIDFEGDGKVDVKKGQSIHEHTANVGIGKLLSTELKRCNLDVLEVAFEDADISLSDRQKKIRDFGAVVSISNHFNASGGSGATYDNANGLEICIHDTKAGDSKALAELVIKHLVEGSAQKNRGIAEMQLALCNTVLMKTKASILIEYGFMTNKHEAEDLMGSQVFWKECAVEVAKGVCEYLKIPYVPKTDKPASTTTKAQTADVTITVNKATLNNGVVSVGDGTLNIRKGAGANTDSLGVLKNGQEVKIISEKDGWGEIEYTIKGYVSMGYITKVDPAATTGKITVYSDDSLKTAEGTIPGNTGVLVLDHQLSKYPKVSKIKCGDLIGYVNNSGLKML